MGESYFHLKEKNTSVRIEVMAGITTFLTMAYIIFVNPSILSLETIDVPGIEKMDKQALIAATCLVSGISTLIVGIFANAPIAMAPGMGLNAFFVSMMISQKIDWRTALGAVFIAGLIIVLLTLFGLRKRLIEAIPESLVSGIAVGIGLFITFMGLKNLGIIVNDEITLVKAGSFTGTVLIGLLGLLVMITFEMKKIKGGLVAGILLSTILAVIFGLIAMPEKVISFDINISKVAFKLDILGALKWGLFGTIFTLMFIDLFDSLGTLVACCYQAKMVDENNRIKGLDRLLSIDAVASMIGGLLGTSTTTSYIESATGIEQGGRTGLTSIVTGVAFLLALPFVPLVGIVPTYATAPALIMVGLFMMKEIKNIDFFNLEEAFPAFIIMVMIALSYSISTGLAFGFVSYVLIKIILLKAREIKPAMWIIGFLSLLFLTIEPLTEYFKSST